MTSLSSTLERPLLAPRSPGHGWPALPLALPRRAQPAPAIGAAAASTTPSVAARAFNVVQVDAAAGTVTKWSARESQKIEREARFYQQLPPAFAPLFPRLLAAGRRDGGSFYVMDYVAHPSLSELFVQRGATAPGVVAHAMATLLATQQRFAAHAQARIDADALFGFYWGKAEARLADLPADTDLRRWLTLESVSINGQPRRGWPALRGWLESRLRGACAHVQGGFLHGDLCFSNILWDAAAARAHLIDPRGDFLGRANWGDTRYDLAKLLHSAHGGYDFVIHDRFSVHAEGAVGLRLQLDGEGRRATREAGARMVGELARLLGPAAVGDLLLLEGLLFLSMLPLHYDAPQRQMAFLSIGLELLNRCAEGRADASLH